MTSQTGEPELLFTCEFDDRLAAEVEQKGWCECAAALLPGGFRIPLSFWDPARLSQELDTVVKLGRCSIAEPAMIIVPRVTRDMMKRAVEELFKAGYFRGLLMLGYGATTPDD